MVQAKNIGLGLAAFAAGSAAALGIATLVGRRLGKESASTPAIDDTQTPLPPAGPEVSGAAPYGGHVPTDLLPGANPGAGGRAIPAFRPDPTAPIEPGFREALTGSPV